MSADVSGQHSRPLMLVLQHLAIEVDHVLVLHVRSLEAHGNLLQTGHTVEAAPPNLYNQRKQVQNVP